MNDRFTYLFSRYFEKKIEPEEKNELFGFIDDPAHEEQLRELIDSYWNESIPMHEQDDEKANQIFEYILSQTPRKARVRRMHPFIKYAVAAMLVLIAGSATYYLLTDRDAQQTTVNQINKQDDVPAPAGNKAVLTLADGTQIVLDSAANGQLAQQGNAKVQKVDGKLMYDASVTSPTGGGREGAVVYNTLTVPRGSKLVNLTLSDGTRVWLNNESSLRYPTAFVGNTREVEITGEAYFEVSSLPLALPPGRDRLSGGGGTGKKPFIVRLPPSGGTEGGMVQVLGTHFNVNAYDGESGIKVTLLEGSVEVKNQNTKVRIKPGEQATTVSGELSVVSDIDLDEVIAWKNGKFIFNGNDITTVMREIGRWYDVDVSYEGKLSQEEFVGVISRQVNISEILQMLERTKVVSFEVEGRKVKVISK